MALTEKQEAFAQHYVRFRSGPQAYVVAYRPKNSSPATIVDEANRLLRHPLVAPRISALEVAAAATAPVTITLAEAFALSLQRATTDPRELLELRRKNCRCCYGEDFKRQWKEDEYCAAMDSAAADGAAMPDIGGGFGWLEFRPPNEDCPECGGVGLLWPVMPDTRTLSPAGARLYRGYKIGKGGTIEILTWDQGKDWENCIRMLGGFKDNVDLAAAIGRLAEATKAVSDIAQVTDPHVAERMYREMTAH